MRAAAWSKESQAIARKTEEYVGSLANPIYTVGRSMKKKEENEEKKEEKMEEKEEEE